MEDSRGKLLNGDRVPFHEIEGRSTIDERPGRNQWWGRFWLPGDNRVEPIRKYCLICGDGRPGEMIIDRFGPSEIVEDVALQPVHGKWCLKEFTCFSRLGWDNQRRFGRGADSHLAPGKTASELIGRLVEGLPG